MKVKVNIVRTEQRSVDIPEVCPQCSIALYNKSTERWDFNVVAFGKFNAECKLVTDGSRLVASYNKYEHDKQAYIVGILCQICGHTIFNHNSEVSENEMEYLKKILDL